MHYGTGGKGRAVLASMGVLMGRACIFATFMHAI